MLMRALCSFCSSRLFFLVLFWGISLSAFSQETPRSKEKPLKLWYTQPASNWVEALPVGNGRLGGMIFGGVAEEHIQFNEESLWSGRPRDYHREGAVGWLPEIRKLLSEGKQEEAEELAQRVFMGRMINEDSYDSLQQDWLAKISHPEGMGGNPSHPEYDDSEWKEMTVPTGDGWRSQGLEGLNGAVWFRYSFQLPAEWAGEDLVLELGRIRDRDITYVNGEKVGSLEGKDRDRSYTVPSALLSPGKNVIAVQVLSFFDKGGFTGFDDSDESLSLKNGSGRQLALDKHWKYKIQDAAPPEFPDYMARYLPFGDLNIHFPEQDKVEGYRRELDIARALVHTSYTEGGVNYRREYFASAPHQAIVLHFSADRPGKISFTAGLNTPHALASTRRIDDRTLGLSLQVRDGALKGESRLMIQAAGGSVSVSDSAIQVEQADSVSLYLVAGTNFKNYQDLSANPGSRCSEQLKGLRDKAYPELKSAHKRDYQRLFNTFAIRLGNDEKLALPGEPEMPGKQDTPGLPSDQRLHAFAAGSKDPGLAALYLQYSRYLLISSSRAGTQAANLQGIWNHLMLPPWDSKYTTNINLEMNYWPAEVLNLPSCHEPLLRMISEIAENGKKTAKAHYNCRGWVLHHNTDIWRGTAPVNASNHGIWVGGGAWLCHHLWEHYRYSLDREFLKEQAYPLMKGAALFYADFLIEDPETGWLISSPSNSPELGGLVAGPAMGHQLIRDLFRNCIQASKLLNVDTAFRNLLQEKLAKIAPNQIGRHGQLQEWLEDKDDPEENHRHVSHLWGVHPGNEINWAATPELMKAARQSLLFRGDEGTGWSLAWKINLWARFQDGDHAYRILERLFQPAIDASGNERGGTYPNFFDSHPPFQIDGNFGGAAGIAEMLVQSQEDFIELLPALPAAWPSGEIKGLRVRGGFTLNFRWEKGRLQALELISTGGEQGTIRYGKKNLSFVVEKGESLRFNGSLEQMP